MPQSLAQIYLHIVFSTKQRQTCFQDETFARELHSYLAEICNRHGCFAKLVGGHIDHVHLLCSLSRQKTIADLIRDLKTASTAWIRAKRPELSHFHWQDGYGVFSVSPSQSEKVKHYIRKQDEHHKTLSFQDEFRALLIKHELEFNEKYVWD